MSWHGETWSGLKPPVSGWVTPVQAAGQPGSPGKKDKLLLRSKWKLPQELETPGKS